MGYSQDFEVEQTDHWVRIVDQACWQFVKCAFDFRVESVQEVEVLDLVDSTSNISPSS